jgi:hypothetical protein
MGKVQKTTFAFQFYFILAFLLYFCGLFYDTDSNSDYIASVDEMIN